MDAKENPEKRIEALEQEVRYLRALLDRAGVSYVPYQAFSETPTPKEPAILPVQITPRHAQYFYSVFKGRRDVYAKRGGKPNPKTGKTGYYTQCHNFWRDGLCPKKYGKKTNCAECENQRYKELTASILMEHLQGNREDQSDVVGLYAMLPDETCNFLVFDFDAHEEISDFSHWKEEIHALRQICKNNHVPVLVERSRSGNGAHLWMFFREPIPAVTARQFGSALLTKGAESVNLTSFHYYDRMIPAQDHLPLNPKTGKPGLGNLVALPLQGQALKKGNSAFLDEDNLPYPDQWKILREVEKIERPFVENALQEWTQNGVLGVLSTGEETDSPDAEKPWEKPKTHLFSEDISGTIEIVLADKVYIATQNIKPRTQNILRRMAAFENPNFYKTLKMGFSTKGIPRIIYCGYDDAGYLCLPRALQELVLNQLDQAKIPYTVEDKRIKGHPIDLTFRGTLYPEQQAAAETMLASENGILAATTAFGKTVVGAYMIAQRKVSTLIIVHNTEILKNWADDLEKFLAIHEELPTYTTKTGRVKTRKSVVGTLYAGHDSMNGILDIAIFSSLKKNGELHPLLEHYGMAIMDECHHGAADTIGEIVSQIKARYVYGLTATPKRDDGMEKRVYMQFGPIRFRYTAKERAAKQNIPHYVYPRFTRIVSISELKITEAYQLIVASEARNQQIVRDVETCLQAGRTPLVLTKYKEHAIALYDLLKNKADHAYLLHGGGNSKAKDALRNEMRNVPQNESVVLVATDKYIGEGFNFPRLDTLMLAMPVAWEGNVEQYVGRLHRDYDTKENVLVYDYVDAHIPVLEKMYHKRMRTYKKIGYEIYQDVTAEKQQASSIFDGENFLPIYEKDLFEADHSIIISSPGINKAKVSHFLELVARQPGKNLRISVFTLSSAVYQEEFRRQHEFLLTALRGNGITVIPCEKLYEHFAIIDDQIVWYGNINLLSRTKSEDNIIRIASSEIADELKEMMLKRRDGTL